MQIYFEKSFLKDIKKLDNKLIAKKLKNILQEFESSQDLSEFNNIKKMKGHTIYYRLKINDYRLGFSYEDGTIEVIRFLHRKDIYKLFP